ATLSADEETANSRFVRFVTLKTYEKAGGAVRRDLFATDADGIFILDPVLLHRLVTEKLAKATRKIAREGWKWIEVRLSYDLAEWTGCRCYSPEPVPFTAAEQVEHDTLAAEQAALFDADEDLTEELRARSEAIAARLEELDNRDEIWPPKTLAI